MIVDPELYNEPFSIRGGPGATPDPLMNVPPGQAAARGYPDIASGQTWSLAFAEATSIEALRLEVESLRSRLANLQEQADRLKQAPREMQVTQRRTIGGREVLTLVELGPAHEVHLAGFAELPRTEVRAADLMDKPSRRGAQGKLKESRAAPSTLPLAPKPNKDDD